MTQFLRDQAIDSEEVVTPLMLDGTYLSRNFATLGPMIRQPPCDLRSCAWLLHPNIKNQGKGIGQPPDDRKENTRRLSGNGPKVAKFLDR